MSRIAQGEDAHLSRSMVLETLCSNRLLAQTVPTRFAAYDLQIGSRRVGFEPDVQLDDMLSGHLRSVYGAEIEAQIKAMPGGNLQQLVQARHSLSPAQMDGVFGAPQRLLLDYTLNPGQIEQAKQIVLLQTRLPQATQITLYELFRRQNVQGRVEFFNRNQEFMQQQGMLYLGNLFVLDWARQRFGAAAVADLRQSLYEQLLVRALEALHGIGADTDAESRLLGQLAAQTTAAEIEAYYNAHKEEFKRIEWVRARHIRVADEARAREVAALAARLPAGDNAGFAALARRYSTMDAASGGDLGQIKHQGRLSWLQELAMMQQPGKASPPIRAPLGPQADAYWEIVWLEQRKDGYQPLQSESVRYLASRAVAQQKGARQLGELRERLLREASIALNRKALEQPARLPALGSVVAK